jgi:preprotein translocase subunit SecE
MNAKAETATPAVDYLKWLIAASLLAAGVWGFYQYEGQILTPIRVLGLLAAIAAAAVVGAMTDKGRAAVGFMKAANIERQKVVWPTRDETVQTTIVVLVVVVIVGLFVWLLDWVFASLVSAFVS